ncbi:MAG: serine/threonine-protein kinase, partial [Terriglobales bacterium]
MSSQDDREDELLKTPPASDQSTTPLGSADPHATIDLPKGMSFGDARLAGVSERYELQGELGRGGMGIVYRARDKETGELVALKVLKPEIASEQELLERFKNELRLARQVTHKRVCRTYELLRFGDTVVIAMEYVEGESLRVVLDRFGGLPLRKGIQVAQQVCSALAEAHAQGIVHRDLKPENLMLDRSGNVKVMDFGIARSVETGSTTTGGVIGTPAYMAPEQAEGKPVDARTDIYALGLILYEVFTGKAAFRADTPVALAMKQIRETPPAPREVEPTLPVHIEKAILK